MIYDLAIIGGGPAGYVAAERAGNKNLSVILFEKNQLGGVCLNEGCIPTKTLLYSAKIYENAVNASKYGITASDVSYDYISMIKRKNLVVKKLVAGVGNKMKKSGVKVIKEGANILGRDKDGFKIEAGNENYQSVHILVCTGSDTIIPPIGGLDLTSGFIVTHRELLDLEKIPGSLVIIGGGVIGIEFASLFNSLGSKVTVIEIMDKILIDMDDDLSRMAKDIYTKKGIVFHLSAKVKEVNKNEVVFESEQKLHKIKADKILLSTGRKPVTEGIGLENLGVEIISGNIKVDNQMRTNIPNLFAAGDVTGFSLLAHTASREGEVVVNNLTGRIDTMRYEAIPNVVYSNPEIACVGLTEKEAGKKGINYRITQLPMVYSGRFLAENTETTGLCKIIAGAKYGEVLGVHIIGNPSSEIIYGAAMAIENEMTIRELEEVIFPHPTVSEIIKETLFSFS